VFEKPKRIARKKKKKRDKIAKEEREKKNHWASARDDSFMRMKCCSLNIKSDIT